MPDHSGVRNLKDEFSLESLVTPQSQRVASSFLIDLRRHPRHETRFAAEVVTPGGIRMNANLVNLSRSGLLLEGSRRMAAVIFPNGKDQGPHTPASLQVTFSLPGTPGQYDVVRVQCRTVHARFVEDGSYRIGMRLVSFDKGEQAFVRYLLRRAETG